MAGEDMARKQLIEGMKNAWVSAEMYFPDDPMEALVSAVLDNPKSVLRALGGVPEEEVRTWDAGAQHEFFRGYNRRAAWWFPWEAK